MKYNIKEAVRKRKDLSKEPDALIVHFILNVMGPLFEGKSPIPFNVEDGVLEIEVKLNGLDVDPTKFFEHLSREFDRCSQEEAKKYLTAPMLKLVDSVNDMQNQFDDFVRSNLPKASDY